jgi:hypothetical protein
MEIWAGRTISSVAATTMHKYSFSKSTKEVFNVLHEHQTKSLNDSQTLLGPGGSMSYVVRLTNNSYKPITNTA